MKSRLMHIHILLVVFASIPIGSSFVQRRVPRRITRVADVSNDNTEKEEKDAAPLFEKKKPKKPDTMTLVEYAEKERQAAKRLQNRLLLPNQIGKAINIAFYVFVIFGFLLNISGYAYVRSKDGGLTIGTLEDRQFQNEIYRVVKPPTDSNEHIR